MNRWARVAGTLGLAGGSLGLAAGIVQATIGSRIPEWTGNKSSPVALGLLTMGLSALALSCSAAFHREAELPPGRRVATSIGMLVPAGLCFSTVGVLWYPAGVLLLVASGIAVASGDLRKMRAAVAANWFRGLVSTLGGFELVMAAGSGRVLMTVGGLVGIALVAAPWMPSRVVRVCLLLLGAVPFAALTWWSLVSPLVAVLALSIGLSTFAGRAATLSASPTLRPGKAHGPPHATGDTVQVAVPRAPIVEPAARTAPWRPQTQQDGP